MDGAPSVFGFGYLFEVFHAVVEDIAVFVVDFFERVMSLTNPSFVYEDVAMYRTKMAHLRISAPTFAVVTESSRSAFADAI